MDFLSVYDFGVMFLEKHPKLKRLHDQLSGFIMSRCQQKKPLPMEKSRMTSLAEKNLKRTSAFLFCIAGVFFVSAVIALLQFLFLKFIILSVLAILPYAGAVNNVAKAKLYNETEGCQAEAILVSHPETVSIPQVSPSKEEKREPTKNKSLFWRIWGFLNNLVLLGWIYASIAYPETLNALLKEYHVWDYLPYEKGNNDITVDKIYFIFLGILVLSPLFNAIGFVLKTLFLVLKKLFPKRDIREL